MINVNRKVGRNPAKLAANFQTDFIDTFFSVIKQQENYPIAKGLNSFLYFFQPYCLAVRNKFVGWEKDYMYNGPKITSIIKLIIMKSIISIIIITLIMLGVAKTDILET